MNNLDLTEFLESYLPTKFPDYKISGDDFMTNSIFTEDRKRKLGINLRSGLWHCFKTDESGDFYKLYSILENKSYQQAVLDLTYKTLLGNSFKPKLHKALIQSYHCKEEAKDFIPISYDSYDSTNEVVNLAWQLLYERKLFDLKNESNNTFFACDTGFYKDRLIIPYLFESQMVYFQGRSLKPGMKPKYLCPKEGEKVCRGADVLYPFNTTKDYVVICEGPIDARSLQIQDVNATCVTGIAISETQINALRIFGGKIIMGLDNDEAGKIGLKKAEKLRKAKLMPKLWVCYPPDEHKDWNSAHQKNVNLKNYIETNMFEYNLENYITKLI